VLAGAVAGVNYWLLPYPLDTIKSAIQADSLVKAQRKYHSIAQCARTLYQTGGIRRFYVGLLPCMLRALPANAASFVAYEHTKLYLNYYDS
jgi:solute carrier family 25 carnitine/acylcarnitine transporter 20/29